MRRLLTGPSLLLASVLVVAAAGRDGQSESAPARIKIDVDRAIGEVHPHLFGNFAEHLGRMIYGGIYEEASAIATTTWSGTWAGGRGRSSTTST